MDISLLPRGYQSFNILRWAGQNASHSTTRSHPVWRTRQGQEATRRLKTTLQGSIKDITDRLTSTLSPRKSLVQIGLPGVGLSGGGTGIGTFEFNLQHEEELRRVVRRARLAQPRPLSTIPCDSYSQLFR